MFGRDAAAEEEKEKEKEKDEKPAAAVPSSPKKGGQPNITTVKMREYERKMRGGGSVNGTKSAPTTPSPHNKMDEGVTLENVVKEYNVRMGRTAFGRAAFDEDDNEDVEKKVEEPSAHSSPMERSPQKPSTPPLTKEEMREMYDNMYKANPSAKVDDKEKVEVKQKECSDGTEENNGSPMADTKWEQTR